MGSTIVEKRIVMEQRIQIKTESGLTQRLEYNAEFDPDFVFEILGSPSEPLQVTQKRSVCRHGDWVVKKSLFDGGVGPLKHTFKRARYRIGWNASVALANRGVNVAKPIGFFEQRFMGVIWTNCLVMEYLKGCVNIKEYLSANKLNSDERTEFLTDLSASINHFIQSGAYSHDLKVQNLLTADGKTFHFIDLDEVVLDKPYPADVRMKNHIQILYGLHDQLSNVEKKYLIDSLGADGMGSNDWISKVDQGVQAWIERKNILNEKYGPTVD